MRHASLLVNSHGVAPLNTETVEKVHQLLAPAHATGLPQRPHPQPPEGTPYLSIEAFRKALEAAPRAAAASAGGMRYEHVRALL
eukprot:11549984-Prorocentrum_lima.AAC.1